MARTRRRGGTNVAPPAEEPEITNGRTGASLRKSPGRSYGSHREWLLAHHGSVCAYCGTQVPAETITLDHVRPRRGQSAYDRPDNLVLACRPCNAAKADTPLLAFLMAKRARGVFLLHYRGSSLGTAQVAGTQCERAAATSPRLRPRPRSAAAPPCAASRSLLTGRHDSASRHIARRHLLARSLRAAVP